MSQHAAPADDVTPAPAEETREDRRHRFLELGAAMVLGLAATATAFAAYESGKLGGDAIAGYSEANNLTSQAADVYGDANGQFNYDRGLFLTYAGYLVTGDTETADVFRDQFMSENLQTTIDWYDQTGDEVTDPFDEEAGSPYALPEYAQGNDLTEQSEATFAAARAADEQGGQFDVATVLLALSLFFAGIASVFTAFLPQAVMLGVGTVGLLAGLVQLLTAL
ncbi:MAG: hypothetical protein JWQ53_3216 [Klenkia sp.]|nr:hypothetical protein [Klenkia sp.]